MSLPPGFLDELRNRLSLAQVVGRKVMWDSRKSNQGKGDMWAPCPFHDEKTASFHVDDRKGYYYCFGCHAKGDAISFVRETENVGFMEAVQILAGEAGMQVPARDPEAQKKADRRTELTAVMEQAVQFFKLQLKAGVGAEARDYLSSRGFDEAKAARWDMGFAPGGWQALFDHMTAKGVAEQDLMDTGLAKPSNSGKRPYDTFRNRIMFPIRDGRGRPIAFGGRAMDPGDNAKYLNSPETLLFDKGRQLYNHGPAREAAGKGHPLIVAEGYMDVIALSEAGFGASVAPLGTAVTEDQLRLLWRISPEPIIALDGDTAGLRAARRLIDLALPMLEAGQSLRFAVLPEGQDPDDLLKSGGPAAMEAVLDRALPMVQLLWERETAGGRFDSPERKAALDKALREKIKTIKDPSIRSHYGAEIARLRRELFAPARTGGWTPRQVGAGASARRSLLAGEGGAEAQLREDVILATVLVTPDILPEVTPALERLRFSKPEREALRQAVLTTSDVAEAHRSAADALMAERHVQICPPVRKPGDIETARQTLEAAIALSSALAGREREVEEAAQDLDRASDEGLTWRLSKAAEAVEGAARARSEDDADFEVGANGARINRDELSEFDRLLSQIGLDHGAKDPN